MGLFGKKEESEEEIPIRDVEDMLNRGLSTDQIINYLRREGYSTGAIRDALSQAQVRQEAVRRGPSREEGGGRKEGGEAGQPRQRERPPEGPPSIVEKRRGRGEDVERMVETIVEEKWRDVMHDIQDLEDWRADLESRVSNLEEKIGKIGNRIKNLEREIERTSKEKEKMVETVKTEMDAFEKVVKKMVPEFTSSVKSLSKTVDELKEAKGTKGKEGS